MGDKRHVNFITVILHHSSHKEAVDKINSGKGLNHVKKYIEVFPKYVSHHLSLLLVYLITSLCGPLWQTPSEEKEEYNDILHNTGLALFLYIYVPSSHYINQSEKISANDPEDLTQISLIAVKLVLRDPLSEAHVHGSDTPVL